MYDYQLTKAYRISSARQGKSAMLISQLAPIKDYITDQVKLEPHRMEKHFVRRRKLSLLQVIIYLFFSSKASMFQNLSQIREELGTLSFPDVSKQALSKARQFINPSLFKELYYLSVPTCHSIPDFIILL